MRRKIINKEELNGDRWIVSYADLLTLLFCFFVVMYSISSLDSSKYQILSSTLETELSNQHKGITSESLNENADQNKEPHEPLSLNQRFNQNILNQAEQEIDQIARDVEQEFHQLIDEERVQVKRNKFWLEVEFKSNLLYPSGSSELLEGAKPILISLAERLAPMANRLNIEGFTDNRPIKTEVFPSNWELSAARAATVVRLFESSGVAPVRMASIGYGEHQPIAENMTEEGRALNRRVVVVVMAALGGQEGRGGNTRAYKMDELDSELELASELELPSIVNQTQPGVIAKQSEDKIDDAIEPETSSSQLQYLRSESLQMQLLELQYPGSKPLGFRFNTGESDTQESIAIPKGFETWPTDIAIYSF